MICMPRDVDMRNFPQVSELSLGVKIGPRPLGVRTVIWCTRGVIYLCTICIFVLCKYPLSIETSNLLHQISYIFHKLVS